MLKFSGSFHVHQVTSLEEPNSLGEVRPSWLGFEIPQVSRGEEDSSQCTRPTGFRLGVPSAATFPTASSHTFGSHSHSQFLRFPGGRYTQGSQRDSLEPQRKGQCIETVTVWLTATRQQWGGSTAKGSTPESHSSGDALCGLPVDLSTASLQSLRGFTRFPH